MNRINWKVRIKKPGVLGAGCHSGDLAHPDLFRPDMGGYDQLGGNREPCCCRR